MTSQKDNSGQRLEAENKRLKRLIKRLHQGLWGTGLNDRLPHHDMAEEHLPLYISSVLVSQIPFAERIGKVMEALGSFVEVSRIYIFENIAHSNSVTNTYEWCNDGVSPEIQNLQEVSYDDFPNWKRMLEEDGIILTSNIQSLPPDLCKFLKAQTIEAILVIPLIVNGKAFGFIGFDECSFTREWLPHEMDLLRMASRLIANAYENQINQARIIKQSNEQQLLLDISRLLITPHKFSDKINYCIENLAQHYDFHQVLIYECGDNNRFCSLTNKFCRSGFDIKEELHLLNLSQDLPGWMESFNQKGHFCSITAPLQHITANVFLSHRPNSTVVAVPIRSKQSFWGFMVAVGPKKTSCTPLDETPLPTIADMFAGTYEREDANLKLKQNHDEILMINNELEKKEAFLQNLLSSAPIGIMMVRNRIIEYMNDSSIAHSGYTKAEVIGSRISDFYFNKEDEDQTNRFYKEINDAGISAMEVVMRNKSGVPLTFKVVGKQIPDFGPGTCYLLIAEDISERKQNELALKMSEQKFRALTENSPDHIIRISRKGTLSFCNSSFLKDFDITPGDCLGKKLAELSTLPPQLVDGLNNTIADVLISKNTTPVELEFAVKGQMYAFDWTITPETDEDNQLSSLLMVGRNFTLRKRAEQELIVAKEAAESADRLKSAFLANMSHEIRTPLNAIVGFTTLMNEKHISDKEKEEYIRIINNSSENLMELINDIVDLAKIESGEMNILIQEENPNHLLEYLFSRNAKRLGPALPPHLKFYLHIPENSEELTIPCDIKRLEQVMNNLLSNAFKFTPKGFIEMGYTLDEGLMRFFVRDTGIGIDPDKSAMIFESFRQEDESTSKLYGGTGLGLSIAKRLLEAMGSRLQLSSEKSKGSEFSFTLPVSKIRQQTPIKKVKIDQAVHQNLIRPYKTVWPDKIILLLDATSTAQLQIRKHLNATKITLISARTPNSARELLLNRKDIDLVLIDINMPGLVAEHFIRNMRELHVDVPFIAQSVAVDKDKIEKIIAAGYNTVLTKPVAKDELISSISHSLSGTYRTHMN